MRSAVVPLPLLRCHPANARSRAEYSRAELADLTASIREHGLLQPLVVTPDGDAYTILAGHRRHAALKALGHEEAPCVVVDADEAKGLAILLTDNGQHKAVDPLKEADTIGRLVESLAGQEHPHDRAAAMVGKSPSWVRDRLRLRALSPAWRKAFADPECPTHEWPVAHLEVVAALPEAVQDQVLADNESAFAESVPLAVELRRLLAEYTRDLSQVPWDLADATVVDGAPACNDCPRRDVCEGFLFKAVTDTKKPRCLDAACFDAKRGAKIKARIDEAVAKYGDALAIERCWLYRDVPLPENIPAFQEYELVPMAKAKGGFPVLRLKTLKVVMMGQASTGVVPSMDGKPPEPAAKAEPTLEERREGLEKRRVVRALTLLRGSLLDQAVQVGTGKHPEEVTPAALGLPILADLMGLVLAFGTEPGGQSRAECLSQDAMTPVVDRALSAARATSDEAGLEVRQALWTALRPVVARAIQPHPGIGQEATQDRAQVAALVCQAAGVSWAEAFLEPATQAIPEPRAWSQPRRMRRA